MPSIQKIFNRVIRPGLSVVSRSDRIELSCDLAYASDKNLLKATKNLDIVTKFLEWK